MFTNASLFPRTVKGLDLQVEVAVEEECDTISAISGDQNAMPSTTVVAARPPVHRVTHVDYEGILDHRDRNPGFG